MNGSTKPSPSARRVTTVAYVAAMGAALLVAAALPTFGLFGRVKRAGKRAQEKNAGEMGGRQDHGEEGEEYSLDWLHAKESDGLAGRPEEDPDRSIPEAEGVAEEVGPERATTTGDEGPSPGDVWGEDLPEPAARPLEAELTAAGVWGDDLSEPVAEGLDTEIAAGDIWGEDLPEPAAQPLDTHDLAESVTSVPDRPQRLEPALSATPGLGEPQGFEPVPSEVGTPISLEQALDLRIRFERARLRGDQAGMEIAALALDAGRDPRALRDLILALPRSIMRREEILEAVLRYPWDQRASEAGKLSELPANVLAEISRQP